MAKSSMVNTRGPWFCPYCGTLGNLIACGGCLAPKPFEMPLHNTAGNVFSIVHGPIGYWGLPKYMAAFLLAYVILGNISLEISRSEYNRFVQKYSMKY
ncbi:MAG: hypothetical protein WCI55_05460 [Armatimonadota bacterium]